MFENVAHVRKSTVGTEILEGVNRLQTENCTRWNSQLTMILSVLNVPKEMLAKIKVPQLTAYERKILAELVEILLPFLDSTEFVQIEKYPSAGYVLPCMKRRHQPKLYILASKATKHLTTQHSSEVAQPEPEKEIPISAKRKHLFSFLDSENCEVSSSSDSDLVMNECTKYLGESCEPGQCNPLEFWKEHLDVYPTLAKVALEVLHVLASSSAVERIFSTAGLIYKLLRCRLFDERFEQLIFVKCNGVTL